MQRVFSTSVEVFPGHTGFEFSWFKSSPRPWRCFLGVDADSLMEMVFSTSVEVFPPISINDLRQALSSPRPWRCFRHEEKLMMLGPVFSTSVEVFPLEASIPIPGLRLLHVRGGVSITGSFVAHYDKSSPRPWRCLNISVPGVVVVYSRELNGANCS